MTNKALKREILLVKVANTPDTKEIVKKHNAVIADESPAAISIEAVGQSSAIEDLLAELKPHGIRELVQSGLVALERGYITLADRTLSTMGTANWSDPNSYTADYQNYQTNQHQEKYRGHDVSRGRCRSINYPI